MITDLQVSEKADSAVVTESSNAKLKQGTSGSKSSSWNEKVSGKNINHVLFLWPRKLISSLK